MRNHSPSAAGADPRRRSRCQTMSDRPCNGGHGVTGAARRWRCAAGSCWPAPRACRTWRSASTWGCIRPRSPNGAAGSPPAALRASATSRGRGCPARSPTPRSSGSSSRPWRRPPPDATHWSTRSLARATGMSQTAVSRIWRAFGLKPHLAETWKLSTDPQFIDKVRDLCGLYLNPPEAAVVLCVDEKSQIQALDRTAPVLPLMPGSPQRRSHDSTRHGTTNLYAALNLASGLVISQMTPRHRAIEFRRFLDRVDQAVPAWLDVHVICEDSSTHKTPAIRRWLVAHPRSHVHFTPTYSSWLNLVERGFAELARKWLRRGSRRSVAELTASIQSWIETWNQEPRPFVWTKTADQILDSIARYLQPISNSGRSEEHTSELQSRENIVCRLLLEK